jgi:hypothetical protein
MFKSHEYMSCQEKLDLYSQEQVLAMVEVI